MRCPYCQHPETRVVDSRPTDDGTAVRRRRECPACGRRCTTYERIESDALLRVVKRDGRLEAFDRRKVLQGMLIACEKRPVPSEQLEAAVNRVHQALLAEGEREVSSRRIGELVMEELRRLDQVAYVRFASVYRQFADIGEFAAEVARMQRPDGA